MKQCHTCKYSDSHGSPDCSKSREISCLPGRTLWEPLNPQKTQPIVTREMLTAAHGVTLEGGQVVLSAALLERIYLAMRKAEK